MDISSSSLVPRLVADLRPSADAAATARVSEPPAALAPGPALVPVSLAQAALVAHGLLEPRPVGAPSGADLGSGQPGPRVLKPWGVLMLPAEDESGPPGDPGTAPKASHADGGTEPDPAFGAARCDDAGSAGPVPSHGQREEAEIGQEPGVGPPAGTIRGEDPGPETEDGQPHAGDASESGMPQARSLD